MPKISSEQNESASTPVSGSRRDSTGTSESGRLCSLIPGLGVNLSTIILAGSTVLSAVGARPQQDGARKQRDLLDHLVGEQQERI